MDMNIGDMLIRSFTVGENSYEVTAEYKGNDRWGITATKDGEAVAVGSGLTRLQPPRLKDTLISKSETALMERITQVEKYLFVQHLWWSADAQGETQ